MLTGGVVGLNKHFSAGHEIGMRICVKTTGLAHELHHLRFLVSRWPEFKSRFSSFALVERIVIRIISINVTTVYKAANENDGTVAKCFDTGVPTLSSEIHGVIV